MPAFAPSSDLVFVYGTLRPGERNAHWLGDARHLGSAVSEAAYTLCDTGPYPAALPYGHTALIGDVYAVDRPTLDDLDTLESYPVFYSRRRIATDYGPSWIYVWAAMRQADWPVIIEGDWTRRAGVVGAGR